MNTGDMIERMPKIISGSTDDSLIKQLWIEAYIASLQNNTFASAANSAASLAVDNFKRFFNLTNFT